MFFWVKNGNEPKTPLFINPFLKLPVENLTLNILETGVNTFVGYF